MLPALRERPTLRFDPMNEYPEQSVEGLMREFAARRLSPVEVVDACAARIEAVDGRVGGFTALCLERAREEALASEAGWARGEARGLEGIPFGVKDLFDSEGVRTAYGSPMFDAHVPSRDAEAVRRARASGAILLGKTQTHEFAWGITSVNEALGSAHNPWALDRLSGGSSGGSAVVLAAGEVPLALGSDTGGSIRVPAAFCGIVGLKPTYGRISAARAWPLARSLDHPGPMAKTPADAALFLEAIAGVDADDPSTVDMPLGDVRADLRRGLAGLVVGTCSDLLLVPLAPDVRAVYDRTLRTLEAAGARLVELTLPEAELVLPAFRTIQSAEALETHRAAGLFPARRAEYGADVLGRLDAAGEVTLEQYLRASADRERVRAAFERLFGSCDVLLTPVSAGSPLPIGEETLVHEGEELTFRELVMSYTTPQDLVGLPACAVRAGFDALGIPVGLQFTAPPWQEGRVLRAAQGLFDATPDVQSRRPSP
jgi:aspartyl-tRNA(Asn)/glutamyl-tRNA(Gln) amidotransferase subunit A